MMSPIEWGTVLETMEARWPGWSEGTGLLVEDVKSDLHPLNHDWVMEALARVRRRYASDVPKMKWILSEFEQIKKEHSVLSPQAKYETELERIRSREAERRDVEESMARVLSRLRGVPQLDLLAARDTSLKAMRGHFDNARNQSDDPAIWSDSFRVKVFYELQSQESSQ